MEMAWISVWKEKILLTWLIVQPTPTFQQPNRCVNK